MSLRSPPPFAAALLGVICLLVLDGDVPPSRSARPPSAVPPGLSRAVGAAATDLSIRAAALAARPEVARSLAGGGIAVNRLVLFSAARQVMEGAAPGSWIALTDPAGAVHAWWGDAPASLAGLAAAGLDARWSATTMTLVHRRSIGEGRSSAIVYCARTLPAQAPEFAKSLGASGNALSWEPMAPRGGAVLLRDAAGRALVEARAGIAGGRGRFWSAVALAGLLFSVLFLIGGARDPLRIGAGLALAFVGVEASSGSGALLSWRLFLLALGPLFLPVALARRDGENRTGGLRPAHRLVLGYGFALLAAIAADAVSAPQLGSPTRLSTLARPAALTALLVVAVALAASGRRGGGSRPWMTAALLVTALGIVVGLIAVSPSVLYSAAVVALFGGAFELWTRAVGSPPSPGELTVARLFAGAGLLAMLLVAPASEHRRASRSLAVSA